MEIFNANPTGIDFEARWAALYEGVKRCNQAIRLLSNSTVKNKEQRLAEMRFLRGHYYFNLKVIYNLIPWIDETVVDPNEYHTKSNMEFTSDQLWEKILGNSLPLIKSCRKANQIMDALPKWRQKLIWLRCIYISRNGKSA